MPYFIEENNPSCAMGEWATVKEDGEVMGCHEDKQGAIDQALAIAQAEDSTFEGELPEARELPDNYRPATADDVPEGRACGNCIFFNEADVDDEGRAWCERWDDYVRGGYYCNAWQGRDEDRQESEPAPPEDQIEGSEENEPGSAKGAGGDIKLSEATEKALRNKVTEHNERMEEEGKPDYTRTTYGQLAAVYRRGAGAYSTSHRPGVSRGAWAMARVNAYLYLLRNGKPENAKYVGDNDLLPEGHPKSTRSVDEYEQRQVDLTPPAYMRASARRGLQWHEEGLSGDGLQPQTVREARAMADGSVTADKWVRIRAFLARHMVDFDAPAASPDSDDFPSPGVVAIALWGGGTTRRSAQRAMDYADGVIGRIEAENENRVTGEALSKLETRVNPAEFEVRETEEGMTFSGYAAVFNSDSQPLPFTERIAPGAFRGSLRNRNDIKLLWNHDTASVLGSVRAGTLKLTENDRGLYVEAVLPNTSVGRDARELISRGDVDAMSFGFTVARGGDEWSPDGSVRTLTKINLHEVSIVAFPAYTATAGSTAVRGLDKIAKRADVDPDALADALLKIENGEEITADDRNLITTVLDKVSPVEEKPDEPDLGLEMLALKKKKLELLMGN
jgi:hypothetical protein